jgi:hypothetical protein
MASVDRAFRFSIGMTVVMLGLLGVVGWRRVQSRETRIYPVVKGGPSDLRSGRELIMVVIGANGCGASRSAEVVPSVSAIREQVARYAAAHDLRFSTLGIATDVQPNSGLQFLLGFREPFDEIAIGRNWLGLGATTYLFRDKPGEPSIPQVLIIERDVTVAPPSGISIGPDRVVARRTGVDALVEWSTKGLTTPAGGRIEPIASKPSTGQEPK